MQRRVSGLGGLRTLAESGAGWFMAAIFTLMVVRQRVYRVPASGLQLAGMCCGAGLG